ASYPSEDSSTNKPDSSGNFTPDEGNVVLRKGGVKDGEPAIVDLNEVFRYRIYVYNNTLTVSAWIKGELYWHSQVLHSFWVNDPCYFKAGNYRQANRTKTDADRKAVSGTTWVRMFNCVKSHSADTVYYGT
ncbi:polysaccharide lyase family 7 protein, partial [Escherichia coli]|nr:polysaccharide lyase family 7 protein [Escherichia coli]